MHKQMIWLDQGLPTRCVVKRSSRWELTAYRRWVPRGLAPPLLGWAGTKSAPWLFLKEVDGDHPDWARKEQVEQVWRAAGELHSHSLTARRQIPPGTPRIPLLIRGLGSRAAQRMLLELTQTALPAPLRADAQSIIQPEWAVLVHGDLHRENLLTQGERLYMLDWEGAALAHPIWELLFLDTFSDGWEGFPRGEAALHGVRTYHRAGPLGHLTWDRLIRLQRLAQLLLALLRRRLQAGYPDQA